MPRTIKRLHVGSDSPALAMRYVAIALNRSGSHVGILHRGNVPDGVEFLHLAFDHDLRREPANPKYGWVEVEIPDARARQIAAFCRLVGDLNPSGIPYAFSAPQGAFDELGLWNLTSLDSGLTCATFVLAVFEGARVRLTDYPTWLPREEDRAFQEGIVDMLRQHGAPANRIAAIKANIVAVRFRPLEVAASAAATEHNVAFCKAMVLAELLGTELASLK
jgi:hypothetical protein